MKLQLKRGTAAEVAAYTGPAGELVVGGGALSLQDGATAGGHVQSGVSFTVETPTMTLPANGAVDVKTSPILGASNFSGAGGFVGNHWQVASDAAFNNIIHDSGQRSGAATSYDLASTGLVLIPGVWYARVRYESSLAGWSEWSTPTSFTTAYDIITDELVRTVPSTYDNFNYVGEAVDISDDGLTMVVGVPRDDTESSNSGAVYVFEWENSDWVEKFKYTSNSFQSGSQLGFSVAVNGNGTKILAGAPYHTWTKNVNGNNYNEEGKVVLLEKVGNAWQHSHTTAFGQTGLLEKFGASVAFGPDDTIFIGATTARGRPDGPAGSPGAAYVFTDLVNETHQKLYSDDGLHSDYFGRELSVSADGNVVVVGAHSASNGAAYVFRNVSGTWTQVARLDPSPLVSDIQYALQPMAISTDGSLIAITADISHSNDGACYVYEEQAPDTWTLVATIHDDDPGNQRTPKYFGTGGVMFNNNASILYVGHPNFDATMQGAIYAFAKGGDASQWTRVERIQLNDPASSLAFGYRMAMTPDDSRMVVGARQEGAASSAKGAIYTFV